MSEDRTERTPLGPVRVAVSEYRPEAKPPTGTLQIEYNGKLAYLELPMPKELYPQEPGSEAWRRELHTLLDHLDEWIATNDVVIA